MAMMGDGLDGFGIDGYEAMELARWHDGLARDEVGDRGVGDLHDMHEARAAELRRYAERWTERLGAHQNPGAPASPNA